QAAWEHSKNDTDAQRKALADTAISSLVIMEARLGRVHELQQHIDEISHRPFYGSSEIKIRNARDGLWSMIHHPEISFKCGPYALNTLASLKGSTKAITRDDIITKADSTSQGTNLLQLQVWAHKLGLNMQLAKREHEGKVLFPSVMHWRVSHFAAIVGEEN